MAVTITPDPKHPRGGFAKLVIEGAQASGDPVVLSIFNSYQQKWLGPKGWQPSKADLTPREAMQDGATLSLILGPDIVNTIEEDTPIRIEIGADGWDTYWPDDINAGPDEALVGDIGGTGVAPDVKKPTVVKELPCEPETPEPEPEPEPENTLESVTIEPQTQPDVSADEPPAEKSRLPWIIAALAVLLIGAVAAYFLTRPAPEPAPAPPAPAPQAALPVAPNLCDFETLTAQQANGFGAVAGAIRSCGADVTPDNALRLLEQATAANDPAALDLFGVLYDNTVTDADIEDSIGLTFADDPARAADYYARAVTAGSAEAPARLQAICRRLLLKSDTLSQSAREDHCS